MELQTEYLSLHKLTRLHVEKTIDQCIKPHHLWELAAVISQQNKSAQASSLSATNTSPAVNNSTTHATSSSTPSNSSAAKRRSNRLTRNEQRGNSGSGGNPGSDLPGDSLQSGSRISNPVAGKVTAFLRCRGCGCSTAG